MNEPTTPQVDQARTAESESTVDLANRPLRLDCLAAAIGDSHHRNRWVRSDLAKAIGRDFACHEREDALWPPAA